ncbi:MAG: PEP-CTERM sorting domain-containing protein [Desulfuromonadales bacterium]
MKYLLLFFVALSISIPSVSESYEFLSPTYELNGLYYAKEFGGWTGPWTPLDIVAELEGTDHRFATESEVIMLFEDFNFSLTSWTNNHDDFVKFMSYFDYFYIDQWTIIVHAIFQSGDEEFSTAYVTQHVYYSDYRIGTRIGGIWPNDGVFDSGIGAWVVSPVPEPSTFLLLAGGLASLAFAVRRRRKE